MRADHVAITSHYAGSALTGRHAISAIAISPKAATGSPIWFQASMRRAIAAAMARSNRDIPHYYLQTRIDMTRALRWLETENAKRSIKAGG